MFFTNINSSFQVTGLQKGNKYLYRVSAENEAGVSDPSEILGPLTADDAFGKWTFYLQIWEQHPATLGVPGT